MSDNLTFAIASNGSDAIPLVWGDGEIASDDYLKSKKSLYISGRDAFHSDVVVKTTLEQINECIEKITKKEARIIFPKISKAIRNTNTDVIYNTPEWGDFCDDIILYYACRFILFKKPMPMIMNDKNMSV